MAHLEIRDLTVRYGTTLALDAVHMSASRGEIVGLLGPNGAGKTTLLDVIAGSCAAERGSIRLGGEDVTRISADARARRGIARTFQAADLIPSLTVGENVLLGCQSRYSTGIFSDGLRLPRSRRAETGARQDAEEILDQLALGRHRDQEVGSLPLGTRRMVEIARAMCLRPSVLLLDEVGSGMEGDMLHRFAVLLSRLAVEGVAVVLIEHDADFVLANCDFIYVLSSARVVARGTSAAVRRDPVLHDVYLGRNLDAAVAVG